MKASVIITTYNWPDALSLVLRSLMQQSADDFEVIVADDGSSAKTDETVRGVLSHAQFPWKHVKHEDDGIRQARVKNLGVRFASGGYLVFIDHDVALHPEFVRDHLQHAAVGIVLQGKRVFLSEERTRKAFADKQVTPVSPFAKGVENRKNAIRLPGANRIIGREKSFQTSLRGCNLSMHRSDFMAVDGYDETFDQLWGREDSDICYRLFHSGVKVKNLWFCALQFHLYHRVIKNRQRDRLDEELAIVRKTHRTKAVKGYSTLSEEGEVVASSNA